MSVEDDDREMYQYFQLVGDQVDMLIETMGLEELPRYEQYKRLSEHKQHVEQQIIEEIQSGHGMLGILRMFQWLEDSTVALHAVCSHEERIEKR